MPNYRVIIGEEQYYTEDESVTEAASKIVELKYKHLTGEVLLPIAILVQDIIYDGSPEMEDNTAVLYSPEIFANVGMHDIATMLKNSFNQKNND